AEAHERGRRHAREDPPRPAPHGGGSPPSGLTLARFPASRQAQLGPPRKGLHLKLPPQRVPPRRARLAPDEDDGAAARGIARAAAGVVRRDAPGEVVGDAAVEGAVGAAQEIAGPLRHGTPSSRVAHSVPAAATRSAPPMPMSMSRTTSHVPEKAASAGTLGSVLMNSCQGASMPPAVMSRTPRAAPARAPRCARVGSMAAPRRRRGKKLLTRGPCGGGGPATPRPPGGALPRPRNTGETR